MPKISETKWLERKKIILDAAFELFTLHGYTMVSVNDIVKKAEISKGGFYTYFASKEEIFYEFLKEADLKKEALVQKNTEFQNASMKVYDYFKNRLLAFTVEENKKWIKFSVEFWSNIKEDENFKEINEDRYRKFQEQIEELIEEGIKSGEFKKNLDMEAVIFAIISMIDGIGSMTAVMGQSLDGGKIEVALDILMSYLKV